MTWGTYYFFYECPQCGKKYRYELEGSGDGSENKSQDNPKDASQQAEDNRFYYKLQADGAVLCAKRLARTDFSGTLGNGNKHNIHNADSTY